MAKIGGNDPTQYSYSAADGLITAARNTANALEGQSGSRASYVSTAKTEFRGFFADVFGQNAVVASRSAAELVTALRKVATFAEELRQAAHDEDKRRADARAWEERQRRREEDWFEGLKHDIASLFGGGDDPRPPAPDPEPVLHADEVSVRGREIPAPAGGSGTSSAIPANLRSFQTGIANLDSELRSPFTSFKTALTNYESRCNGYWGTLTAQSLATAFQDWLDANGNDADWAGEVAAAFEAAGSGSQVVTVSDASIAAALESAGVSVYRDGFTIGPFSAVGTPPTNGFSDDPVNTATGNFLEPELDLPFAGAAASLGFGRMYNALDPRIGAFGVGWTSALDLRLELDDEGAAFIMADGRQIEFPRAGDGWDRGVGENYWLAAEPVSNVPEVESPSDQLLVVRDNSGKWWAFTPGGVWLGTGAGAGTTVTPVRDETGRIVRLRHERGRSVEIEYAAEKVAAVLASDGRRVEYLYDDAGRLTGVADKAGTRRYRWNSQGLIDQVISAAGVVECENTYDSNGRVIEQLTPFGRRVRYAYMRGRVTSVSNHDGSNANTWIADRKGRVVGIVDAAGKRQSMAYDPHGNLVSVTERDGQVTVHKFNDRGLRLRTVTPEGGDITYAYDEHDRLTTVVDISGGVAEYRYPNETDRNPSILIDPCDGRTEMVWDDGLLTRTIDPEGVTIDFMYDDSGDLVGITNAAGDTSHLVRDQAGRVVEAVSPGGARTRFRYDEANLLVAREDADGALWRFEHGDGGKVTAIIDPYGARTEMEYGPHGELTTTTDALGRTITRGFDEQGLVSSMTLPDGAEWMFAHDAISRLRAIVDPDGGLWTRDYDATGQLASTVDPTGVRTDISRSRPDGIQTIRSAFSQSSVETDEYGRPVRQEQPDGSASMIAYDACGRPVELLDADGGLTKVERDLAGRVTRITSPTGRTTRYEYDACGRPVAAVDAAGARTTLTYDADSRVIARTSPTGDVTEIEYDPMGRIVRQRIPGVGISRYRYDKARRLVAMQDPRYGRRTFAYDAAGQLIAATNGVGGVTRYEYDVRGRMVRIIDPLGGVTERSYTQLDKVASTTDPLGRTTRATYDEAGRLVTQTEPDGTVTERTYDAAGIESGMKVNGKWVTEIHRDPRTRTATITDHTRPGTTTSHTLRFNRLDRLVERVTSDGDAHKVTRWEYDADGARTALIAPDGTRVDYARDQVGRVVEIAHTAFGTATFEYDAAGRMTGARAGDLLQSWRYEDGYRSHHTRTTSDGVITTDVTHDADGRIVQIDGPEGVTQFDYDDACQLVGARSERGSSSWSYDDAGRLVSETGRHGQRSFRYDAAGQLLSVSDAAGQSTLYAYDAQGRRIHSFGNGCSSEYTWDERGWLSRIKEHDPSGSRQTDMRVNALGELAEINGAALSWDVAAPMPSLLAIGETTLFSGPGGLTGVDGEWSASSWRTARTTAAEDPWSVLESVNGPVAGDLPSGVELSADGGLQVAGLEWMGARAYDPTTRGFLSVDPLTPATGAAWSANPYSFAGNDPLHALDPLGLAPITDDELDAYAHSVQGPLTQAAGAVGHWFQENWEYVAGGAMVVAGGIMIATGVGGPVGMALIGAGADTIIQKATTGEVNWGQVAVSGAFGLVGGGVATSLLRQTAGNAFEGAIENVAQYAVSGQPITAAGLLSNAASGAVVSTATAGALNSVVPSSATPRLDTSPTTPNPPTPHTPPVNEIPSSGSTFVVTPNGTTYDIPAGWPMRDANNGLGLVAQRPGAADNADSIRIMEPTNLYPNGYSVYYNSVNQPLNPNTGKPGDRADTHVPAERIGEYLGWPN